MIKVTLRDKKNHYRGILQSQHSDTV